MGLRCAFGFHAWQGCRCTLCRMTRDLEHNWDGCLCEKCGVQRDEGHKWNRCVCSKCKAKRDEKHQWERCKCRICGAVRDEQHEIDGLLCKICKKTRAGVGACAHCGSSLSIAPPFYNCGNCSINLCKRCALKAGSEYEHSPIAFPRCVVCHRDLRSSRKW